MQPASRGGAGPQPGEAGRGRVAGRDDAVRRERTIPGLDAFWMEADREGSSQHPLERELGHRLDALARYHQLIEAAEAEGRERVVEILLRQREREERIVRRLRRALRRVGRDGGG
jgi:hypothetical protein